jgi:hypothetical protein
MYGSARFLNVLRFVIFSAALMLKNQQKCCRFFDWINKSVSQIKKILPFGGRNQQQILSK